MRWMVGGRGHCRGSEAKKGSDIVVFPELDSGSCEGFVEVLSSQSLANVQLTGILEGKDCTL